MAHKHTGRRHERAAIEQLEGIGWQVEDVTPNLGSSSRHECDLLLQWGDGDPLRTECKYRSNASGFAHLYPAHLHCASLRQPVAIEWADGYRSGGLRALTADMGEKAQCECWHEDADGARTKGLREWLEPDGMPPRDVLLLRASANKRITGEWIAMWRVD